MAHYIAMSGMRGCLPDYCCSLESVEDAVESLAELFGDSLTEEQEQAFRRELSHGRFHEFADPAEAGAQYAEITECDCPNPEDHDNG